MWQLTSKTFSVSRKIYIIAFKVLPSERNLTYLKAKLKNELQTFISSRIPSKTRIAAFGEFFKDLNVLNVLNVLTEAEFYARQFR